MWKVSESVEFSVLSSIEEVSLLFTLGVILGKFVNIPHLSLILPIAVVILGYRNSSFAFLFCGWFTYIAYTIIPWDVHIPQVVVDVHNKFVAYIDTLPCETKYLIKAFLQGDKSDISPEIKQAFKAAGVTHLLALSGMHMGVIYIIFNTLIPKSLKYIRYVTIVSLSFFFTLMVGAGPSITRAFLFILIRETALIVKWRLSLIQVLAIALMIQLSITPTEIEAFGFQLSYISVFGIAVIYPHLDKWYDGIGFIKAIWQALAISISTQILVAPIIWYRYHSFPVYFLVANLFAVPATSMYIGISIFVIFSSFLGINISFMYTILDLLGNTLLEFLKIISLI